MSVEGLKDSEVLIVPKSDSKTTLEGIFFFFPAVERYLLVKLLSVSQCFLLVCFSETPTAILHFQMNPTNIDFKK